MGLVKDLKKIKRTLYWAAFEYVKEDGYQLYIDGDIQRNDMINYVYVDMKTIFPLKAINQQEAIAEANKIVNAKFDPPKLVGIAIFDK